MEPELHRLLSDIPYARVLGIVTDESNNDALCRMMYAEAIGGLAGLHGGALGALLEVAAALELRRAPDARRDFRLLSLSLDYLRAGRPENTFARAYIVRQGRRVANVRAEAWQGDRSLLIATAQAVFSVGD
jgi:acyl-coenzyme A thioesterase PaaI-like protein